MRSIVLISLMCAASAVYGNVIPQTGLKEDDHHAAVNQAGDDDSVGNTNQDIDSGKDPMVENSRFSGNGTIATDDLPTALSMLSSPGQIVQMHNSRRARHQVPPVGWSSELANFAQRWANKCYYGHTNDPRYGENIAMGLPTWESVMKAWHDDEENLYNYRTGGFSLATGHFTQIVWRDTTAIGCAAQVCPGGIYFVCEYAAPGNVQDEYRQNVFPSRY